MNRSIPIFLILVFGFAGTIFSQNPSFVKATSQRWTAGIRGGGGGVNYVITLVVHQSSAKLKFNRLWIGEKSFQIQSAYSSSGLKNAVNERQAFAPGDTVLVKFQQYERGEIFPNDRNQNYRAANNDSVQPPPPYKFKGEGLISFKSGKKKKYLEIESFEKLQRLAYP